MQLVGLNNFLFSRLLFVKELCILKAFLKKDVFKKDVFKKDQIRTKLTVTDNNGLLMVFNIALFKTSFPLTCDMSTGLNELTR